jgi:hypothetical protein
MTMMLQHELVGLIKGKCRRGIHESQSRTLPLQHLDEDTGQIIRLGLIASELDNRFPQAL